MIADADPQSDSVLARQAEPARSDGPLIRDGRRASGRRLRAHRDLIAIAILFVAAIAMRRPLYMVRHVFWLDEAWVADSVRAPLHALRQLTSATPIGFTFLLRLVPPVGGLERIRLVPLLFSAALAPLAYMLGRTVDPGSRWRAWALGVAGVLLPVSLRHDLKQYTADAFFTLLLALLVARAEREWSVRRLVALTSVACVAPLISHTSILVSLPAFALLIGALLVRGQRRPAAWTAGAAALSAASFGAVYLLFDAPGRTPMLVHYWDPYYVPIDGGTARALSFVHTRWSGFLDQTGLDGRIVAGLLLILGCFVLFRLGRYVLALLLPTLLVESIAIASLKLYPLWDHRTSTYLTAFATIVGVIGLVCGTAFFPRHVDRRIGTVVTIVASLIAVGLVARSATESWSSPIRDEDTRSAALYIATHREPGDVVLVDFPAAYGFAFYWRADQPRFVSTPLNALGFVPTFDTNTNIEVRTNLRLIGLNADVQRAARRAAGHTLWIVISHEPPRVFNAYLAAAQRVGRTRIISAELISVAVPPKMGQQP